MAKQKNKKPQPKAKRDDFSSSVKKTMAERVAYLCSNPACRILTVGPHSKSDKVNRLGEAAHITAAIEGGERFDPSLTPEQRKHIDNGIWLCCDCHKLVDSDPDAYPVELLRQWKAAAEAEASANLGKPVERKAEPLRYPLVAPAILLEEFVPGSRDRELAALSASLEQERTVYLWGFGGMGKSETAIRLAHDLAPADRIFLMHYQNSMRETILKLNFEGYKFYATEATNTPETYAEADLRQRMKMLKEGYRDAILIVDNFDVEGKTLDQLRAEPACQELLTGGFRLIFTTRSPLPRPDWEIKAMTREYQLKLMRNLAPDLEYTDDVLGELIDAVKGHTLTLSLMAKTLSKSWGDVTPTQILDALRNSRWEELESPNVASGKDRDNTQRRIEAHLCALFDLSKLSDDAKTVLSCATLLPDGGMKATLFRKCLSAEQKDALVSLAERNWLTRREGLLTIHPVMRQVCRMVLKPNDVICGAFLEELWKQYDEKDYNAAKFQQIAACFAAATDTLRSRNALYPNHAGQLYCYIGQNDSGLTYFRKAVELVERHDPENSEMLGTMWSNIGSAYVILGDHHRALEFLKKALEIGKQVLPSNHPGLASSYNNVGSAYSRLGDHRRALEYYKNALEIFEQVLSPDHPDLATAYNNVGGSYRDQGDHRRALEFLEKALEIKKRVLSHNHPDLATAYDNIGSTYKEQGNPRRALEYMEKALEIRKQVLPTNHPDLAASYNNVGSIYGDLGDPRRALEYIEKSLDIYKQVLPPNHPDLTKSYFNVGGAYNNLGNHRKALEYGEKALDIFKQVLPPDHPDLAWTYYSTGMGYLNLLKTKEGIARLLKAQEIWEKSLPAGHPLLTRVYDDLSQVYAFSGRQKESRRYRRLAEENSAKTPK